MEYIAYFTVIFVTLGCCFLVDHLLKRHKEKQGEQRRVRPAKRSVLFGIIVCFLGLVFALNFGAKSWLIFAGAIICLLMGVTLIVVYFCTGITYDEQGFTYRAPGRRAAQYRYADITGERALMTRGGVNAALMVGENEIYLYESMDGVGIFLKTAYEGWLKAKGLDSESCPPPNPACLVWFPEPPEA